MIHHPPDQPPVSVILRPATTSTAEPRAATLGGGRDMHARRRQHGSRRGADSGRGSRGRIAVGSRRSKLEEVGGALVWAGLVGCGCPSIHVQNPDGSGRRRSVVDGRWRRWCPHCPSAPSAPASRLPVLARSCRSRAGAPAVRKKKGRQAAHGPRGRRSSS